MIEREDHAPVAEAVAAHEGLVDLDRVEREALQVGQRRIAGAEIVERQAGAELAHPRQHLRRVFRVLHHQALGHLELQRAALDVGAHQHRLHVVDQVVAQQLPARHVDAGEERRRAAERLLPVGELARGAVEHEQAERDDQAGALGERHEIARRDAAELGMVPAHQRLEAGDGLVLQPHDRLVEHLDLLAAERAAEIRFERREVAAVLAERRPERLDAVAAEPLGVIHAHLGVPDHLLRPRSACRRAWRCRSRR